MFEDYVICPNNSCSEFFEFKCEWENAGDGSEHEATCPHCGTNVVFEIAYAPHISNEREI